MNLTILYLCPKKYDAVCITFCTVLTMFSKFFDETTCRTFKNGQIFGLKTVKCTNNLISDLYYLAVITELN